MAKIYILLELESSSSFNFASLALVKQLDYLALIRTWIRLIRQRSAIRADCDRCFADAGCIWLICVNDGKAGLDNSSSEITLHSQHRKKYYLPCIIAAGRAHVCSWRRFKVAFCWTTIGDIASILEETKQYVSHNRLALSSWLNSHLHKAGNNPSRKMPFLQAMSCLKDIRNNRCKCCLHPNTRTSRTCRLFYRVSLCFSRIKYI